MTDRDIEQALRLVESALRTAKETVRWAQVALNDDKTGGAHQAWVKSKDVVRDLENLKSQLQAVRPS